MHTGLERDPRIASEESDLFLTALPISVEEEVDPTFFPSEEQQRLPSDFQSVDLAEFWEAWRYLERSFVALPAAYGKEQVGRFGEPPSLPSTEAFVQGAIQGLAGAVDDPYTQFFAPEDADSFAEEVLEGEAIGVIGAYITINKEDKLTIVKAFADSPAFHGGLETDDVVLEIDTVSADSYTLDEAISHIRGPVGTPVVLKIYRPSQEETFSITLLRDQVTIPTVETEVRDDVFIIRLFSFTKQTPNAFVAALKTFAELTKEEGGATKLLLDLRGNSGGILSVALYLSGLFLSENSVVLYEYTGDEVLKVYRSERSAFRGDARPKMTVLVDAYTASASEIMASALRYHGIADIVGTVTTGKGSVQTLRSVGEDGAFLKVTTSHWLTPEKKPLGGIGIQPDVSFEDALEEFLKEERTFEERENFLLDRALQHLRGK